MQIRLPFLQRRPAAIESRRSRRTPIGSDFQPAPPPPPAAPLDACPYLALDHSGTRASWASQLHRCFTSTSEPRPILPVYQQYFCLTAAHGECAHFIAETGEEQAYGRA